MKKLLVLIALLLGTVSAYAQDPSVPTRELSDPASATAEISGYLFCPLTWEVLGSPIEFKVDANKATPIDGTLPANTLSFNLKACDFNLSHWPEDIETSTMHIDLTGTIVPAEGNLVQLTGTWDRNSLDNQPVTRWEIPVVSTNRGMNFTISNMVLWDTNPLRFHLTKVDATIAHCYTKSELVWTVTVIATPKDF